MGWGGGGGTVSWVTLTTPSLNPKSLTQTPSTQSRLGRLGRMKDGKRIGGVTVLWAQKKGGRSRVLPRGYSHGVATRGMGDGDDHGRWGGGLWEPQAPEGGLLVILIPLPKGGVTTNSPWSFFFVEILSRKTHRDRGCPRRAPQLGLEGRGPTSPMRFRLPVFLLGEGQGGRGCLFRTPRSRTRDRWGFFNFCFFWVPGTPLGRGVSGTPPPTHLVKPPPGGFCPRPPWGESWPDNPPPPLPSVS